MSALVSELAGDVARASGSDWLPGSMTLVVLGALLSVLVPRETTRGALPPDREHRAAVTAVVVVPLVICTALVIAARLLELGT
jgi:uncharacterized membrane protein YraQ (UPF0718 family)